jgi:hypothetical protein
MIILDMEQGTPEWLAARLGIPTASRFDAILTPATRKPSKSARGYRDELLAEWILGQPLDWGTTEWTERGTEMETEARAFYELQTDSEVRQVGFILRDDGMVGGSPDGLVGDDGGLEIKCYGAKHHVSCMLGEDAATMTQVQGNLWISEREWWDVLAYNPAMPHVLTRIHRDEAYIADLSAAVDVFVTDLLAARERILAMGVEPRAPFGGMMEAVA